MTRMHEQVAALLAATERQAAASEAAAKLVQADPRPKPGSAQSSMPQSPGSRRTFGPAPDATASRLTAYRPGETSLPATPPSTPSVHGIQARPLLDHTLRPLEDCADGDHVRAPGPEHMAPASSLPEGGRCPSQPRASAPRNTNKAQL
jgi:hypothetical protein